MVITIDGPAAAGKSAVARELARRLCVRYLDTGAMYRAVTWRALERGADLSDVAALVAVARDAQIALIPHDGGARVLCDGEDVTQQIRRPEVTREIYRMADAPGVRRCLIEKQRAMGRQTDVVAEGRDQGTDVFPDAEVKFFLDASPEERTRRRWEDLRAGGREETPEAVCRMLAERDAKDSSRPMGSLRRTDEMIYLDSTDLSLDEVVGRMLREVERRGLLPGHS